MRHVVFAFRQRKGEKLSPNGDWPMNSKIAFSTLHHILGLTLKSFY